MFYAKHSLALSQLQTTASPKFSPQIGASDLFKCNYRTTFVNPNSLRCDRFVSRGSLAPGGPPLPDYVHKDEEEERKSPFPSVSQLLYLDTWKGLVIGVLVSLVWGSSRFGPLLKIKNEVETVVEVADIAAEITEFLAEKVEEMAADKIRAGGRFKGFLTSVEMAAKVAEKDAKLAEEFLDKVKEVEKEVDVFLGEEKENPIELAIEKAEEIAEVVEKVSEWVEKAAEEVPEDAKFKAVASLIEKAAKEAEKDAERVEQVAKKAEEAIEGVETIIYGRGKLERIIRTIRRR